MIFNMPPSTIWILLGEGEQGSHIWSDDPNPSGTGVHTAVQYVSAATLDFANDKLARVEALHKPWSIYDECGHGHKEGEEGTVWIDDIGVTCAKMYDICATCCADGGEGQTEECISSHLHGEGKPICKTAQILSNDVEN